MNDKAKPVTKTKTNAAEYSAVYEREALRLPVAFRLRAKVRSLARWLMPIDDFEWTEYPTHYRAENTLNRQYFTDHLGDVEFVFTDGKLYLLADCKPMNPTHRCLVEAICNLPHLQSVGEVGVGGGRNLANIRAVLGHGVHLSGYDVSPEQLSLWGELFPDVFRDALTGVLDLTKCSIPKAECPDVVVASTVLMHIQRPDAYRHALQNLLASASKFVVLMDNWGAHDYFADLGACVHDSDAGGARRLYFYDSGANLAIVVALGGNVLGQPYEPLRDSLILAKYLRPR